MAKWSLRNRQDNQSKQAEIPQMPPELNNYYQSERRNRMWGSWLLGFATLIVTIVIAATLFWSVRWAYRQFIDDDAEVPVATQSEDNGGGVAGPVDEDVVNNDEGTGSDNHTHDESEEDGVVDDEAAVITAELPDTGPGDTLVIFLAITALATVSHAVLSKQS